MWREWRRKTTGMTEKYRKKIQAKYANKAGECKYKQEIEEKARDPIRSDKWDCKATRIRPKNNLTRKLCKGERGRQLQI